MAAIGIDEFRSMLKQLLRISRSDGVSWRQDVWEGTWSVEFDAGTRISVYHHVPHDEPDVAGAILRAVDKIVITLEAEEGQEDWPLLYDLFREAQRAGDDGDEDIEAIEEALSSAEPVGAKTRVESVSGVQQKPEVRPAPSLEDLGDGDIPLAD